VDGSRLARFFFAFAAWSEQPSVRPLSAAHVPPAIMPSADQVSLLKNLFGFRIGWQAKITTDDIDDIFIS
jgi:hypothetical protein